jgi:hypothetical protein
MNKYFVMTDERCGGTMLCNLFTCCNLKTIHDPQTRTKTRKEFINYTSNNKTDKLLDYCYNKLNIDLVKCCYISFSKIEYRMMLDFCIKNNIIIIVLHRKYIYKRALSVEISENLKVYNKLDLNKNYSPFSININSYKSNIIKYNDMFENMIDYLDSKKYNYYLMIFEEIYFNKSSIFDLFKQLNINIIDNEKLNYYLNYDYNTRHKLKLVNNLDELNKINNKFLPIKCIFKFRCN